MQTQALPTVAAKIVMAMNETTKIARAVGNRVIAALLAVGKFAFKYVELFMMKLNHLFVTRRTLYCTLSCLRLRWSADKTIVWFLNSLKQGLYLF